MATILLPFPDQLAKKSKTLAKQLGLSHVEFIQKAIENELARIERKKIHQEMINAFNAMKSDPGHQEMIKDWDFDDL